MRKKAIISSMAFFLQAAFHCTAVSNPRVYEHSYKWYIDSQEIPGQRGFYYEIFNVTRAYHDKQVRCSVENELGVAMGLKSIEVKCKFPCFKGICILGRFPFYVTVGWRGF